MNIMRHDEVVGMPMVPAIRADAKEHKGCTTTYRG